MLLMMVLALQQLENRVLELENRVLELENRVLELENRVLCKVYTIS